MGHKKKYSAKGAVSSPSTEDRLCKVAEDIRYYSNLVEVKNEIQEGLDILSEQRAINLENIKDSCKVELQRFIDMRGAIDKATGKIHLPLMSMSDPKSASTINEIGMASKLIKSIDASHSLEEMSDMLRTTSASLGEDLEAVIVKCILITGISIHSSAPSRLK